MGNPGVFPWLAPLVALLIVQWLKFVSVSPRWLCAFSALLFVLVSAYAAYMEASANIAANLGLGLWDGLKMVGPEMALAWQVPRIGWLTLVLWCASLLALIVLTWPKAIVRKAKRI
jgi:hypothetical protein